MKEIFFGLVLFVSSSLNAANCPMRSGQYGQGLQYQEISCRTMISADRIDSTSYRNITFNDEGLIQVFSNFPGTTNSNSTGARVFYLFPFKTTKEIVSTNENELRFKHSSGALFRFDQKGRMSSDDVVMNVSGAINSQNKSGVEIQRFSRGIVVDLGYRQGNSPTLNKNAPVTITDKNGAQCKMINSDINRISRDHVELIYKTNLELHAFLSKKCPQLDLSDFLLNPSNHEVLQEFKKIKNTGRAPRASSDERVDQSARKTKDTSDPLGELIDKLESSSTRPARTK